MNLFSAPGTSASLHLESVRIITERLILATVTAEYTEIIFMEYTPEVARYMLAAPPKEMAETQAFISTSIERLRLNEDLQLVILSKDSNEFLGCCAIHPFGDPPVPEISIWIKLGARGHGYGAEAVQGLCDWARAHLNFEEILYQVEKNNIPSRRIPEKLGGKIIREGSIRAWNGILNEVVFSIPREPN